MTATIAELREQLAVATPGKWEARDHLVGSASGLIANCRGDEANARLIAVAVNSLPGLLDRLERAEARVTELEKPIAAIMEMLNGGDWDCACDEGADEYDDEIGADPDEPCFAHRVAWALQPEFDPRRGGEVRDLMTMLLAARKVSP